MGALCIGDDIPGLNRQMISDYIRYLGNLRWTSLGYPALYPGFESEPESMEWVSQYADATWSRPISLRHAVPPTPRAPH